jgi:hypothetical protein
MSLVCRDCDTFTNVKEGRLTQCNEELVEIIIGRHRRQRLYVVCDLNSISTISVSFSKVSIPARAIKFKKRTYLHLHLL